MEGGQRNFPTTNLTLVQRIRVPEYCVNALNEFFLQYWVPLYFFLREKGETHERASDILQGFIEREILEREQLASWDPSLGRLRTYLKVCLDDDWKAEVDRQRALDRGSAQ